ncbi:hypothetical protein M569_10146, partial [Genlisea aurea]
MAITDDALRQAFMPKQEYGSLREEDKALRKLHMHLLFAALALVSVAVLVPAAISLKIVFPDDSLRRPFCRDLGIQPLALNFTSSQMSGGRESDLLPGAFVLTDQETVDYYWMVAFLPSAFLFAVSVVYLIVGITVAFTAPTPHACLKLVESNYCASRRGGVGCLSVVNFIFAAIFGILALCLGSTLLSLGSSCSLPLFWCYEISSWGLVILHGGVAFALRRKAAVILDHARRNIGIEMLESNDRTVVTPEMRRRIDEGFKSWMGPSFLSSDEEEEDEVDKYTEISN